MRSVVFLLIFFFGALPADAKTLTFPAGSEFFVLARTKLDAAGQRWSFFLTPIQSSRDPICGKKPEALPDGPLTGFWVETSAKDQALNFFDGTEFDRVAYGVADGARAIYVQSRNLISGREDAGEFKRLTANPNWNRRLFQGLDQYVPVSNVRAPIKATDLNSACPKIPQQKNGQPCVSEQPIDLPPPLRKMILTAAAKFAVPAAQIAATIHAETNFDLFRENESEKNLCGEAQGTRCAPYKWGRSFAQLGVTDAGTYGLDWNQFIAAPPECLNPEGKPDAFKPGCLEKMQQLCGGHSEALRPINCPDAAVEAVAKKLSKMIPDELEAVVDHEGVRRNLDLTSILKTDEVTEIRNRSGMYNRGPRVINSFVEKYRQDGHFPRNYGEAWIVRRGCETPSSSMGYALLNREFINRCYVWKIAGLCGELPKNSLYSQYKRMLTMPESRLAPTGPTRKNGLVN